MSFLQESESFRRRMKVFFTATNTDIGFCFLTLLYQKMGASLRLELADELVERMARPTPNMGKARDTGANNQPVN